MEIFTRPLISWAKWGSVKIYMVKSFNFFTKLWDPLDLSQEKRLLDMDYICPLGTHEGMNYYFYGPQNTQNFSQRYLNSPQIKKLKIY